MESGNQKSSQKMWDLNLRALIYKKNVDIFEERKWHSGKENRISNISREGMNMTIEVEK